MIWELVEVTAITLLAAGAAWWVIHYIRKFSKKNSIFHRFAEITVSPILLFILGYGFLHTLGILSERLNFYIDSDAIATLRQIFLVVMISWILIRSKDLIVELIFRKLSQKALIREDRTLFLTISRMITIVVFIFVGMTLLDIIGVPINAILTFGGVGGLAVSWAAKDFIANFFGGVMIQINRHFAIGDWITSPNKHFEGIVEDIGWYMTRVRTFERRPMYIPNSLMTDAVIENPGRMYNRRIKSTVGLRYTDFSVIKPICKEIESFLKKNPHVDQTQILYVRFIGFGASSLDFEIYCILKPTKLFDFRNVQEEIFFKVADIIANHGAEVAYPTSVVMLSKDTP